MLFVVAAEVSEKVRHECDSGTKSEGEEDSQATSIAAAAKGKSPLGKPRRLACLPACLPHCPPPLLIPFHP